MYEPTYQELYKFHNTVAAEDDNFQARQMFGSHQLLYNKVKEILSYILPFVDTVLEIGCAEGLLTKWITDYYNVTIVGIDIAEDFIDRCQKKEISAKFIHTSVEEFELLNYDLIIATEVLEHCLNPAQIVNRFKEHSKAILASVPVNETSINPKTCSIDAYRKAMQNKTVSMGAGSGHATCFTPNTFRELFNQVYVYKQVKIHGIILGR